MKKKEDVLLQKKELFLRLVSKSLTFEEKEKVLEQLAGLEQPKPKPGNSLPKSQDTQKNPVSFMTLLNQITKSLEGDRTKSEVNQSTQGSNPKSKL